jgi:tetratricopeptide (TPR) repeat protein
MEATINQLLVQAIGAHQESKLEEAEHLYREILKIESRHVDANHNLGLLLVSLNKSGEALPLLKIATEVNPNVIQIWIVYADALIKERQFEEAVTSYKKIIELNPDFAEVHYNLGSALQNLRRLEEAEVSYKKAIELKPNFLEAHFSLGNILNKIAKSKKVLEEAEASYKKVIELKPDFAKAHNNLGIVLQNLNRLDEAEASYKKAIEFDPSYVEAHFNLGVTFNLNGQVEKAEISYKKTIELNPKFLEAYDNLSILFKDSGRAAESRKIYIKKIALNPDFIPISNIINKGDWQLSKELLEKMCKKKIFDTEKNVNYFIYLWCVFSHKLLSQGGIKELIKILTKLFIIGERNKDIDYLIKSFFDKIDINTVLKLMKPEDKILINLSYCQYRFQKEDFLESEVLATSIIKDARNLISEIGTENKGWMIIRRSLSLFKNKNLARKNLNNLLVKLEEIK